MSGVAASEVKFNMKEMRAAVKDVNSVDGLEKKVKVVKDKAKLVDLFCTAVEELETLDELDSLDKKTTTLYDNIVEQLEGEPEEDEEEVEENEEEDEVEENEEEDEEEEEDEVEDDLLAEMDRKELKAYIKEQDLKLKVFKKDSDDDIRKKIMVAESKKKDAEKKAAAKKTTKKPAAKKDKKATGTPIKKAKGPGVIGSILEFIDKHGPISQDQILTRLKKRYKDRDPDKMMKTVKVQTGGKKHPIRIERDKKIKLKYDDKGKMSIAKKNMKWDT